MKALSLILSILTLLIFNSIKLSAQSPHQYIGAPDKIVLGRGGIIVDSLLRLPKKRITWTPTTYGYITVNPVDSLPYYFDGLTWQAVALGAGSGGGENLQLTTNFGNETSDTVVVSGLSTNRLMADTSSEADYTIIVVPDIQNMAQTYFAQGRSIFDWIVANKTIENIKAVLFLGDLTNFASTAEFDTVDAWIDKLDLAGIPYLSTLGNHDYAGGTPTGRNATAFNSYFGPARLNAYSWYGGNYNNSHENFYINVNIGSKKYTFMALEFFPRQVAIDWASHIIDSLPDREFMLATHGYLTTYQDRSKDTSRWGPNTYGLGADNSGQELWDKLIKNKRNISFIFGGHFIKGTPLPSEPTVYNYTDVGIHGNMVNQLISNLQQDTAGGNGFFNILRFKPTQNKIETTVYSDHVHRVDDRFAAWVWDYPRIQVSTAIGVSGSIHVRKEIRTDSTIASEKWTPFRLLYPDQNKVLRDTSLVRLGPTDMKFYIPSIEIKDTNSSNLPLLYVNNKNAEFNAPMVRLRIESNTASSKYPLFIEAPNIPNITRVHGLVVGKALTTNNTGFLTWSHVANGSTDNNIILGIFGQDLVNFVADGTFKLLSTPSGVTAIQIPYLSVTPSTPPQYNGKIFGRLDGKVYWMDDTGTEYCLACGIGGENLDQTLAIGAVLTTDRTINVSTHTFAIDGTSGFFNSTFTFGGNTTQLSLIAGNLQLTTNNNLIQVTNLGANIEADDGSETSSLDMRGTTNIFSSSNGQGLTYIRNYGSTELVNLSLVHKRYVDSSIIAATPIVPTLQQIFTIESENALLTGNNAIDVNGNTFNINNASVFSVNVVGAFGTTDSRLTLKESGTLAESRLVFSMAASDNPTVGIESRNNAGTNVSGIGVHSDSIRIYADNGRLGIINLTNYVNQDRLIGQGADNKIGYVTFGAGLSILNGVLSATGSGLTIGTTTITSGTDTRVLFNDAGVVGEDAGLAFNKTTNVLSVGAVNTIDNIIANMVHANIVTIGSSAGFPSYPGIWFTPTGTAPSMTNYAFLGDIGAGGTILNGANAVNVRVGNVDFVTVNGTGVHIPALTSTRVLYAGTSGLLTGSAGFTWNNATNTLGLIEGGVINWDGGDLLLTQTGDVLSLTGGRLGIGGGAVYALDISASAAISFAYARFGSALVIASQPEASATGSGLYGRAADVGLYHYAGDIGFYASHITIPKMLIQGSTARIGVGTITPDNQFHIETVDATTNTIVYPFRISHTTTATAAIGGGVGMEFETENASGTMRVTGTIENPMTDATNATEDADIVFSAIKAGALTEALRVTSVGKLVIPTGSNTSAGVSGAMTAGSITISTTAVTASSLIFLSVATPGGTQGFLSVGTIVAGTSFVINSSGATDTSTVNWWIVN